VTWVPVSGSDFATNYLLAGDQTGRLYAVNAASGADVWAPVSLPGAEAIEAAPVVQLGGYGNAAFQAQYGATTDVVFAVSKNTSTTNNRVYAVRLSDGALLWQFNQTGTYQMDGSLGGAWIDYGRNRLYVVTRAGAGGGQASLWSLNSLTGALVGSLSLGHIEAAPMQSYLDETTLYVGTTGGNLEAIDVSGGAPVRKWTGPAALGSAVVNASLWEDYTLTGRLYLTTQDGFVWALDDPGAGPPPNPASPVWKTAIAGASAPMVMDETTLYVGSSDGKLYELRLTDGVVTTQVTVGNGGAAVGTPSASSATTLYVGTSTGKLFRYALPLP
jgi:outer membrane protein assembly factor BamB